MQAASGFFMSRRRIFFVLHKSFANANEVEIKKSPCLFLFFGEHFKILIYALALLTGKKFVDFLY